MSMKLTAEVDGQTYDLELQREGARVEASVEGRRYQLEARETEAGAFLLLSSGGRVYECRAGRGATQGDGAREVQIGDAVFQVKLADPKRLRGGRGAGAEASGRAQVAASMPGKVVRVLVAVGAQVEAGDGLVVVEAMKMQNELKSPKSGTVVEVRAEAGATVNAGDVLVTVE
ncbi:MAG TPA: biotin/lipoyl-containing protein [Pyrinomonadaceae bacterium]|nr:biotin/lipoyl-containing protein [Pyrinomonadaceae bacterium]